MKKQRKKQKSKADNWKKYVPKKRKKIAFHRRIGNKD